MVQVQDNKNDVGTIKQINKTYKHSMREVTHTDSPSLLFILVYLVLNTLVLSLNTLVFKLQTRSNDQTFS